MMFTAQLGLQLVLAFLALYHLSIGLLSAFAPAWTRRVTRDVYGIELENEAQLSYAVRMLGLYALTVGFLLATAAADPVGNRAIIAAAIFLQSMRATFRLLHRAELGDSFRVSRARNAFNAALLIVQVALMLLWFPR